MQEWERVKKRGDDFDPEQETAMFEEAARLDPALHESMVQAAALFEEAEAFAMLTPRQQQAALQGEFGGRGLTAEESDEKAVMSGILERSAKEFADDPAAYLLRRNPELVDSRAALEEADAALQADPTDPETRVQRDAARAAVVDEMLAMQAAAGVPSYERTVLTKPEAKALAAEMGAAQAPQLVQQAQSLAERYGEYWPRVYGEIASAGDLRGAHRVLAGMTKGGQEGPALALGQALEVGEKEYRNLFDKDALTAVDETVTDELETLREQLVRLPGGESGYADIRQAAKMLAYRYAAQGMEAGEAAEQAAADIYGAHYEEGDWNDGRYRVPMEELGYIDRDPDAAMRRIERGVRIASELGLDAAFETDMIEMGHIAAQSPHQGESEVVEAYRRHLSEFGRWVTAPDETGLILTDGQGQPVMWQGTREPVQFSFLSLGGVGKESLPAEYRFGKPMRSTDSRLWKRMEALGFAPMVGTK